MMKWKRLLDKGIILRRSMFGIAVAVAVLAAASGAGLSEAGLFPETVQAAEVGDIDIGDVKVGDEVNSDYDYTDRVMDSADLLSDMESDAVMEALETLSGKTDWNLFALTTNDTAGQTAAEYAEAYVDKNAFDTDSVCFLIDMDNREIYIDCTGEAIRYMTDDRIDQVLDDAFQYAGDEDYATCFDAMIQGVSYYYDQGIYSDQYNVDENGNKDYYYKKKPTLTILEVFIALAIALAAGAGVYGVVIMKYRLKFDTYSYDFAENSKLDLAVCDDHLVNQFTTRRHIQRDNNSGGSSNGHSSSTHQSNGGGTHSGGGHKF